MRLRRSFLVLTAILLTACAARVSGPGGRNGTPIENALAYNASLADANRSLAETAIELGKSGTVSQQAVTNITSVNFTIADADKQIAGILNAIANCQAQASTSTTPCVANAAQMETLVNRIAANASTLVSSGDIGIKDAATQKNVETAAGTLAQMANLILTTLQTAHLLQ